MSVGSGRRPGVWARGLTALGLLCVGSLTPLTARAGEDDTGKVLLTCTGAERATFTPGLKLYTQQVATTIEQQLAPCVGDDEITTGTALLGYTAPQACFNTDVPGEVPGAQTITWNTGETSRFVYTKLFFQNAGQVVAVKLGSIAEGRFAGATAVMSIPATSNLLECLSAAGNTFNTAPIQFVLLSP